MGMSMTHEEAAKMRTAQATQAIRADDNRTVMSAFAGQADELGNHVWCLSARLEMLLARLNGAVLAPKKKDDNSVGYSDPGGLLEQFNSHLSYAKDGLNECFAAIVKLEDII